MANVEGSPSSEFFLSPRDRSLMHALGEHYCGVYFVRTIDGFVHNLNSPLQILWIRAEQIRQDVGQVQKESQGTGDGNISKIAERMKQRIESLDKGLEQLNTALDFLTRDIVTKRRSEIGPVDINAVITDTLFLLKADMFFKHQVKTELGLKDSLPQVKGQYSDFCIIMLHLIQNALDAMLESDEKRLHVETRLEAQRLLVKVSDTGKGVPPEVGPHIFKPFFSTKEPCEYNGEVRRHAGLGLSHAAYLIEKYDGRISFQSNVAETIFTFELPVL